MAISAPTAAKLRRLRDDRLYYFRSALKIRTKASDLVAFRPNPIQMRIDAEIERQKRARRPVRIIVLKARREGVSTYVAGYCFHDSTTRKNRESLVISHDDDSTNTLFRMQTLMFEELPDALRPMKRYSNRSELVFENPDERARRKNPGLRSSLRVVTAGSKGAGRSKTLHNLHASEVAFWGNAGDTLLGVLNTVDRNPDTFICLESTANGLGGEFYDRYQAAKDGDSDYAALFFAWFDNPEYAIPGTAEEDALLIADYDDEEAELAARCEVMPAQIRWRRYTIANECGGSVTRFHQEYPANDVEAFIVSGTCFFDAALGILRGGIMSAEAGVRGDVIDGRFVTSGDGYLEVWEPPESGEQYVIGGDVAEGIEGGDYSVLQVLRRSDLAQVARWRGRTDPDLFGRDAAALAHLYNDAWLGIEANNHGISANKAAASEGYRYLYHRQTGHDTAGGERTGARLGWETNRLTRPQMLDALHEAIRDGETSLNDKTTMAECTTFVRSASGKPQAANGTHDDCVMAYAIAIKLHELCPMRRTKPVERYVRPVANRRTGY